MIRIAITEDNAIALKSLEEKLAGFNVILVKHTAKNGSELLENLKQNPLIDVILMDIEMPVMNGIEATAKIKELYPQIKIVMITIYDDDDYIFNAIKAEKIYETLTDTLNGGSVMSPSIAIKALQFLRFNNPPLSASKPASTLLSEREVQILELLSKGMTNKNIAEKERIKINREEVKKKRPLSKKKKAKEMLRKKKKKKENE